MLRSAVVRAAGSGCPSLLTRPLLQTSRLIPLNYLQSRGNAAHAISNPTLANIEKRWEAMPPQEQAELWMSLRDRMKVDWHEMTMQEKRASYWIAFGPHGPRALDPPGEGRRLFIYTSVSIGIAFLIMVGIRAMAGEPPRTMTKEWQEATNEYLKELKVEPISGISSEGYKGPGMVQSKPEKKS